MGALKRPLQQGASTEGSLPKPLERTRLRRRLTQQQKVRDSLLLDLGAIIYELHRQQRREPELLQAKAAEVTAADDEVRELADLLEHDGDLLTPAPAGVVSACPACGAVIATWDRFCSDCGTATTGPAEGAVEDEAEDPAGDAAEDPVDVAEESRQEAEAVETEPVAPPVTQRQDAVVQRAQDVLRSGRRAGKDWLDRRRSARP